MTLIKFDRSLNWHICHSPDVCVVKERLNKGMRGGHWWEKAGLKKGREGRDNCLGVIDHSCGFLVYFARRARRACDQSVPVIRDMGLGAGVGWGLPEPIKSELIRRRESR